MKEILVFSELTPNFNIAKVVFELGTKAKELSQKLDNAKVSAVIVNKHADYSEIVNSLSKYGFNKVYLVKDDRYERYSSELYTNAVCNIVNEIQPEIMLFPATRLGRDLAPKVAARLNFGLTADCTEFDINEKGQLASTRPTFGGSLMATILSKSQTQMATARANVFKAIEVAEPANIEIEERFYLTNDIADLVEIIDFKPFEANDGQNIVDAEIVVAGGMGMKNKEGFELLKKFADILGGQVGASRKAVEAGLADVSVQIGQTGKTVTPKLYIACGIAGAIQHLVGMNMSDKIIAINSDPNAPIFKNADYGIVGDVFEVLPKFIDRFKSV
ncbi:electron transfer flavoprotein subunit alpha/FixB family protein [bacterium]|nr:electron transfer flavoprotein subunit alpha/FixB family protein [bacterium]